jgi:hypothetical protein
MHLVPLSDWLNPKQEAHLNRFKEDGALNKRRYDSMQLPRTLGTLYASSGHRPVPYTGIIALMQQDLLFAANWALINICPK